MWSSSIGTTSKIKSIIMGQQGTLKKIRDKEGRVCVHAKNMAESVILIRAIAGNSILRTLFPATTTTTWINAEIPILLSKCFTYVFQSFYCNN
jgi:hypothetical protein